MGMVVGSAARRHYLMLGDVPVFQVKNGQLVFLVLSKCRLCWLLML